MAGYSEAPLTKKLGLKAGMVLYGIALPPDYMSLLGKLPEGVEMVTKPPKSGADLVHLFAKDQTAFAAALPKARKAMKSGGGIWVSWYKKAAKIPTDLTQDVIRARALETDLVDVKICAVNDIWSGLKLVIRKNLR
jgi:hypothetical protein